MKRWLRLDRLVVRLVVITLVVGLVAASVGAFLVWSQARSALREEMEARTSAVAQSLAERFDTRIVGIADTLRLATTIPAIANTDPAAEADLRAILAASPNFDELVLFDSAQQVVAAAATRFLADASDYLPRPELAQLADDETYVSVLEGFPTSLEVAVPIEMPPGQVTGALLARMPLELVAIYVSQPEPTTDAVAFLVGTDGRFLAHPSRDLVAQQAHFPVSWAATEEVITGTLEDENGRSIVAVAPSERSPIALVLQRDEAAALAPVGQQLAQLWLTVVAVIAAIVLAVALVGRRLLQPLDPVSEAVGRLEQGERGVRVDVPGATGEIGALIRQLNAMADSLDRRAEEVAQMHHLSLLVSSRVDRREIGKDLVRGLRALLEADTAAFFTVDGSDQLELQAVDGRDLTAAQLRLVSAEAIRTGLAHSRPSVRGDKATLALPITDMAETIAGVIAVLGRHERFTEDETRLAEAFSSFAGIALENVRRFEYEQALVAELEETIDLRRDLMGRVSHDLRSPIVCIEKFGGRLHREWATLEPHERDQLTASIVDQIAVLDELVTALLDYSQPLRSRRPVALAPISVRPLVAASLDSVASLVSERPIETDIEDFEVEADGPLLTRAVTHLLTNALRFSAPGSPVRIETRFDEENGHITVRDEGRGLSEDELGKAFEPFWRKVVEGHDQNSPGFGLGLTLAAEYLRSMGGSVDAWSEPGRGSSFTLTLPLASADLFSGVATTAGTRS